MRFRTYSYGKKSIDRFLNKIQRTFGSDKKIIIGYGDWSRTTQMKFLEPTMGKGLRRIISNRFETVLVNESYTSQKCNTCKNTLENYKIENKKIHRLQVCKSQICMSSKTNIVYKTRDLNSALNIKLLTATWIKDKLRPKEFTRPLPAGLNMDNQIESNMYDV
jgi:hypothetical protein